MSKVRDAGVRSSRRFAPSRERRRRDGRARRVTTLVVVGAVLLTLGVFSVSSRARGAAAIVASDGFNRSVSNGWGTADAGGSWTVLDAPGSWSVSPGSGSINVAANAQSRAFLGAATVRDVDLLTKVVLPRCSGNGANCDAFVMGRYTSGSTPSYYRIGAIQGQGRSTVGLRAQRSDGSYLSSDVNTGVAAADGIVLWLRVEFQGVNPTTIRGRVWQAGTAEPSAWLLNTTDGTSVDQVTGAVGVRTRNEDTAASHVFKYQSFTATVLSPPPPTTTSTTPAVSSTTTATSTTTTVPSPGGSAAADSFQRVVNSGWGNADTGGWWTVVGSPWSWSVSAGAGTVNVAATAEERAYLSRFTMGDVDVVEKLTLPRCSTGTCNSYVVGRYKPTYNPTYYRVGAVEGAGRANIFIRAQRSDGTALGGDVDTRVPAADGAVIWQRVQFQGTNPTTLRARVWRDGTTEPSTWMLTTTDANAAQQTAGMVGLRFRNEDTSAGHTFAVASYQVTGNAQPVSITPNPTGPAHWLYVVVDGRVYVYDIDNNHALVKEFPIPEAGKRGLFVAPSRGLLYVSECGTTTCSGKHGSLVAYDLVNDVVAWIANYSFGVDQPAITPNGATIYMPHGADASDSDHSILDAGNGKPIGLIQTGTKGHNTVASLDGTQVYLTGEVGTTANYAHVVDPGTNQVILNAGPTRNGVRPFTVNGNHTLMFTTSTSTCGFQVLSLTTGNVLSSVTFSGSCSFSASNAPSHGISLSPDEKRVYVMDAALDQVEVYDVSGLPASPPTFVSTVQLSSLAGTESPCQTWCEREGWTLNDLSGRYVYVADTGDVISTASLAVSANLPALRNTRQLAEIDWTNGTPEITSTRFGIGRGTS
jgi:hypothetical protein